jgi:hypothetical protein
MMMKAVLKQFWLFGLTIGLAFAFLFAAIFTIESWVENPGGIFRDSTGTNWGFVYDTASSWFLPTFLYVSVAASLLHLAASRVLMLYKRKRSNGSDDHDT